MEWKDNMLISLSRDNILMIDDVTKKDSLLFKFTSTILNPIDLTISKDKRFLSILGDKYLHILQFSTHINDMEEPIP